MKKAIALNGKDLTIEDVYAIAHDKTISVYVPASTMKEVAQAHQFLRKEFDKKIIYGVNTGFGPMASHIIGQHELVALQENLIRGHAMGMGNPLPESYVIAAMVVRLNTLVKGHSGVSPQLIHQLKLFINQRIIPMVPEHGAVGTSGDLVQLAHIALALIGEGEVFYGGKRQRTAKLLRHLNIKPYQLQPKEGLSLINGTSMMAAVASLVCVEARRLISLSVKTGAFALESVNAFTDSFSKDLHILRPHHGQIMIADMLERLLASSRCLKNRVEFQKVFKMTEVTRKIPESVQEIYSFRCISQILGPVFDILAKVSREVAIEINSVTDNPIINLRTKTFLHGGNFHGDYIAAGMDQLKASLVKLTMLSERRINFFMNQSVNHFFPPFMNLKKPGLTMGLQGLQFVATSTTAQSQTLAFPQHIHSIPTNGDNQDIVSMGTDATILTLRVVENAYIVIAVELITLAQAADFLGEKNKYSRASRELFNDIRKIFPVLIDDRESYLQLEKVLEYAQHSRILDFSW
jgi:histidine ammonia-lyase